jgi:hypothetical protein
MRKGAIVITSRVVTGIVGTTVAAATIAAAALLPLPTYVLAPQPVTVTPEPATKQLICPGAVLQLGDTGGQNASVASAIEQPAVTIATSEGSYDTSSLRQRDDAPDSAGAPTLVTAPAAAASTVSIAGAQYQVVDLGDYRGLAAASCATPSSDTWLVGGSTAVGRTTLLTLANPGAVDTTVAIELFSGEGEVDASGLTGIIVPAQGQRVLSLAGFGPGLAQLALHVTSSGGPVAANLQQSIVRGIEPGGVDVIGATAAPNTRAVIPGVVIRDSEALAGRLGEDGYDDLTAALRVFVPGDTDAQARVSFISEADEPAAAFDLSLTAGVVTDVPIEGLVDGSYSVVVESSVPVVAAMRASTVAAAKTGSVPEGASDVAWFAAATALGDSAFAAVPSTPGASLHLVNVTEESIIVTVGTGAVVVEAGASVTVDVTGGESVTLTSAEGIFASVSVQAPGRLASFLLSSAATGEAPVLIYRG